MGLTMQLNIPYVCRERDRNGRWRYRFQRHGKKVTMKGEPGSPEFLAHYAALMDNVPLAMPEKLVRGSIRWLVGLYLADLETRMNAGIASPLTLKGHRHHLGRLVDAYGDFDANMPRGKLTQLRDTMSGTPGAADNFLKAVSALYRWGQVRDYVTCENPAKGVDRLARKTTGFAPWTADDFAAYFKHHGPGTMARRCLVLVMSTTARRSDLVKLGRQHEVDRAGRKWLRWKQTKAPHGVVELPMAQALVAEVAGHNDLTYLMTPYGKPYTVAGLGGRFRHWSDQAGVGKSLHGVRKGMAQLVTEDGATGPMLDVLLGHEVGSRQSQVYVMQADRARIALALDARIDALVTVPR